MKATPESMIAETMRVHAEAEAQRQLKQNRWTLTTFGGRTFTAERAGVRLEAPSVAELHRRSRVARGRHPCLRPCVGECHTKRLHRHG